MDKLDIIAFAAGIGILLSPLLGFLDRDAVAEQELYRIVAAPSESMTDAHRFCFLANEDAQASDLISECLMQADQMAQEARD